MKRILLTLTAAAAISHAVAYERVLYQQNFENVNTAEEAGWSFGGQSIGLGSDEYGKFLEIILGQGNGRSAQVSWGSEIFTNPETGESLLEGGVYTARYEFCIAQPSNNQTSGGMTFFTNHAPIVNQSYRFPWSPVGNWDNYIFDLSQVGYSNTAEFVANGPTVISTSENGDGSVTKTYSVDPSNSINFTVGEWYTVEVKVNTETRTSNCLILDSMGNKVSETTRVVPAANENGEEISMLTEGLFIMMARYNSILRIDNIKVSCETETANAQAPTISLYRIGVDQNGDENLLARTLKIAFAEGETLHAVWNDNQMFDVDYSDCNGTYLFETTTSGVLKAYTTLDSAVSDLVEFEVDCTPCVLPDAILDVVNIKEGYGKTYSMSVDNSNVPLRPQILITAEYEGENGESKIVENYTSIEDFSVDSKGLLSITTSAKGYQSTTVNCVNDVAYAVKTEYDFARLTREQLEAAGFTDWKVLNSPTISGFNNWTARKRLYYYDANLMDDINDDYDARVYPFGFISENNTTNVINYSEKEEYENTTGIFGDFENITVFPTYNVCVMEHIGVYNNQISGGIRGYKNIYVHNLDETDEVVYNTISTYGMDSCHPIVNSVEEYYAQLAGKDYLAVENWTFDENTGKYTVGCPIYRIDTACTKITVYKRDTATEVESVEVIIPEDNYYYTIDGLRLSEPTNPGLYIHNGKKVVVK